MTPSLTPVERTDLLAPYVGEVRKTLEQNPEGLTLNELHDKTGFTVVMLRRVVDRLLFTAEASLFLRSKPHSRGAPPRVYKLTAAVQ